MLNRVIRKRSRQIAVGSSLTVLLILVFIGYGYAAYRIQRPITETGGVINQTYLWAGEWNGATHKGVDFSYALDTDVYAVADGTVVDLRDNLPDGDETTDWGNFVLIQHDKRHFDRTTGQGNNAAYVYSMYLHLSQWSVQVDEGEDVNAGDWIGEVDDTGEFSGGNHLHLQIVVHPDAERTLEPFFTLDSENRSRNPELWLEPFNFGDDQTGTVVGKVTDMNGNAVGGLEVCGIEKPDNAGGDDYECSLTYSYDWANPDDILVENWATTDVAPGEYDITLSNGNSMGTHVVEAGKVTYVGLFPVYLPDILISSSGGTSSIVFRNNSDSYTAQVNTTYFYWSSTVVEQQSSYTSPKSTTVLLPTAGWLSGSAMAVASEDVAVVVENYQSSNGQTYSYNGIAATDSLNPGWGQVGTNIHLPLLMDNNSGWSTSVTIFNAGGETATFDLDYYGQNSGGPYQGPQGSLEPNASVTYNQSGSSCPTIGAGRIGSDQPLAVVVRQSYAGSVSGAYNGSSVGATALSLPLIMANNSGWYTGIAVQNLGSANATINVHYDPQPGYPYKYTDIATVAPHSTAVFGQSGGQWGTARWVGSARISASQRIAAIVNETTAGKMSSYNSFANGTSLIVLPDIRTNVSGWTSGVQIQNLDNTTAYVQVWINDSQTWSGSIQAHKSKTFYPVPGTGTSFQGPVTVQCTNGRRIAAIANTVGSGAGDLIRTYNGVNR